MRVAGPKRAPKPPLSVSVSAALDGCRCPPSNPPPGSTPVATQEYPFLYLLLQVFYQCVSVLYLLLQVSEAGDDETPLQQKLEVLAMAIGKIGFSVAVCCFVAQLIK
jgi:hypothetical protein